MTIRKIRFVNSYEKLLSLSIHDEERSLAHGQVPNEISLARSEKTLAPGVGQWDLSAPEWSFSVARIIDIYFTPGYLNYKSYIRYKSYICLLQKRSYIHSLELQSKNANWKIKNKIDYTHVCSYYYKFNKINNIKNIPLLRLQIV